VLDAEQINFPIRVCTFVHILSQLLLNRFTTSYKKEDMIFFTTPMKPKLDNVTPVNLTFTAPYKIFEKPESSPTLKSILKADMWQERK
jgi:hypothetical protein